MAQNQATHSADEKAQIAAIVLAKQKAAIDAKRILAEASRAFREAKANARNLNAIGASEASVDRRVVLFLIWKLQHQASWDRYAAMTKAQLKVEAARLTVDLTTECEKRRADGDPKVQPHKK